MILHLLAILALPAPFWAQSIKSGEFPPVFGPDMHITGFVDLPYAELHEPFEYWAQLDNSSGNTRLDWYGGLDTVIEKPSKGVNIRN